jgi:hypothetical protein
MKSLYIKTGIILAVILLAGMITKKYIMKNRWCKTENGYEIIGFGGMPINIDTRIEKDGCECLTESLLWNPNPKQFDYNQLHEIREKLPAWAVKNIKNFTEEDIKELAQELARMSDAELLEKLKYRYSFFKYSRYQEIYVYTLKIKGRYAYCINYQEVYDHYGNKEAYPPNDEFYEKLKVYYPIIENEDWARNEFGADGVVSLDNKIKTDDKEIYKTYKGKDYTKAEWDNKVEELWEVYARKHNIPIARNENTKNDKGKYPPSRFLLDE